MKDEKYIEQPPLDALLFFSFGGPERKEEVIPFLQHVTRGKNIPLARLENVAKHYYYFGGKSPINDQNRELIEKIKIRLKKSNLDLPIYFANLHSEPFIEDVMHQIALDGMRRVAVFCTSAFSSFSGCKKYRNALEEAQNQVDASHIHFDKIRLYYNHPSFIQCAVQSIEEAQKEISHRQNLSQSQIIFTAHSIPQVMAESCAYEKQLREACALVIEKGKFQIDWSLAFQSRSGPPTQPWLEPDIEDAIEQSHQAGKNSLIIVPLGFISDHMEVIWDLDVEAQKKCEQLHIKMVRAKTVSNFPEFISMIEDLIREKMNPQYVPKTLGYSGPWPCLCPPGCCSYK